MSQQDQGSQGNQAKTLPRSILFVPRTSKGELLTRLRLGESKLAELLGSKVKMVERGGVRLANTLVQKNPWGHEGCGRPECRLCAVSESNSFCRTRSVVYENRCMDCLENGLDVLYVGETGLSGVERQRQHLDDARLRPDKSHIKKHCDEYHPDLDHKEVRFNFKVIKKIPSPFQRQISEAINIRLRTRKGKEILLNNKQEFSRCVLPELEVCMQDRIVAKEFSKEAKERALTSKEHESEDEEVLARKRSRLDDPKPKPRKRRRLEESNKIKNYFNFNSTDTRTASNLEKPELNNITEEISPKAEPNKGLSYGKVEGGPKKGQVNYNKQSNIYICYQVLDPAGDGSVGQGQEKIAMEPEPEKEGANFEKIRDGTDSEKLARGPLETLPVQPTPVGIHGNKGGINVDNIGPQITTTTINLSKDQISNVILNTSTKLNHHDHPHITKHNSLITHQSSPTNHWVDQSVARCIQKEVLDSGAKRKRSTQMTEDGEDQDLKRDLTRKPKREGHGTPDHSTPRTKVQKPIDQFFSLKPAQKEDARIPVKNILGDTETTHEEEDKTMTLNLVKSKKNVENLNLDRGTARNTIQKSIDLFFTMEPAQKEVARFPIENENVLGEDKDDDDGENMGLTGQDEFTLRTKVKNRNKTQGIGVKSQCPQEDQKCRRDQKTNPGKPGEDKPWRNRPRRASVKVEHKENIKPSRRGGQLNVKDLITRMKTAKKPNKDRELAPTDCCLPGYAQSGTGSTESDGIRISAEVMSSQTPETLANYYFGLR